MGHLWEQSPSATLQLKEESQLQLSPYRQTVIWTPAHAFGEHEEQQVAAARGLPNLVPHPKPRWSQTFVNPHHCTAAGVSSEDASKLTASPSPNSLGNAGLLDTWILNYIRGFYRTKKELFNELLTTVNRETKNIFNISWFFVNNIEWVEFNIEGSKNYWAYIIFHRLKSIR